MLRDVLKFLLSLVAVGVLFVVFVYMIQQRMLYFPTKALDLSPSEYGFPFETVELATDDGEALHGWWMPAEAERGALVFCHGNAGNIAGRLESARVFLDLGLSVLLFDYRGYGRSTGKPSEEGLYRDGDAAWRHLTEVRGYDPGRIVVFGRSLGGGVATYLAEQYPAGVLILESAFTSVPDMAVHLIPFPPLRHLVRDRFDNLARIPHVQAPVLVIHSPNDEVIPFEHGRTLYEAAGRDGTFLQIEGGHNDGFFVTGARYARGIDAFLRRHLDR